MPAEFDGSGFNLEYDITVGYLVSPFGWAGAPGDFASSAEISTRYRNRSSPFNALWSGCQPFRSHLAAGDGALTGADCADRPIQSASTREYGSYLVI